ncbi:MAG: lysozyme [Paracoccaceae bacterium]
MTTNPITPRVALEVAHHEAVIRQAYKDSVGVWTWSVGLTRATGHDVTRYIGNPATLEKCLEIFVWALNNYAEAVRAEFKGHNLTEAQFAAALSFHWNTGSIRSASWVDAWKAGNVADAKRRFMLYNKPAAIIPRRKAECALFFDGKWSGGRTMPEYTRVTANYSPVWSSRVNVEVMDILERLLASPTPLPEPQTTIWNEPKPEPIANPWAVLARLFASLLGKATK